MKFFDAASESDASLEHLLQTSTTKLRSLPIIQSPRTVAPGTSASQVTSDDSTVTTANAAVDTSAAPNGVTRGSDHRS